MHVPSLFLITAFCFLSQFPAVFSISDRKRYLKRIRDKESSLLSGNHAAGGCSFSEHSRKSEGYHHGHSIDNPSRFRRSITAPILDGHVRADEGPSNSHNDNAARVSHENKLGTAFYFNGTDQTLKLRDPSLSGESAYKLPRQAFTLEVWVKPEGGQHDPVTIIDVIDTCTEDLSDPIWQFGIRTRNNDAEKSAHYFFSLKTEMANERTFLWSFAPYKANHWTHLAATYDGNEARFYVDSARVGLSRKQAGPLFAEVRSHCKHLFLGGGVSISSRRKTQRQLGRFRGSVDELRLYKRALSHAEIINNIDADYSKNRGDFEQGLSISSFNDSAEATSATTTATEYVMVSAISPHIHVQDSFDSFQQWTSIGETTPEKITADISDRLQDLHLTVPPCGQTVCDNPNVVLSYDANPQLRKQKTLRYRVVNIMNSDGTNPIVTEKQTADQHDHLNAAFAPYNISWKLEIVHIRSSALRRKTIVFGCDSSKIGNKHCNLECRHPITGNDGGDCDETIYDCDPVLLSNHNCTAVCNRPEFNWDNGECCNASSPTVHRDCIDPSSPLRAYIGIDEYKKVLNFTNDQALTITFANWSNDDLIGLSTFPWEKEVHGIQGGIVLQPGRFGVPNHKDNLVHEIGHALGLWHVHHGVSEMSCDDPCRETQASLLTGDLAADTNPTPKNTECRDPNSYLAKHRSSELVCGDKQLRDFQNTPFRNFMSYADESCTDHFSPQQVARIHCYLDLKYKGWIIEPSDDVIPLAPRIAKSTDEPNQSLTLTWLPPLGDNVCRPQGSLATGSECSPDGRILQFASKATSPGPFKLSGYWAPYQATGPPDAAFCEASTKAWLPDVASCETANSCVLELEFEIAVVPTEVSLWVAWNAANGVNRLLLHFEDGTNSSYDTIPVYCDMPFTLTLFESRKLRKVEVHTATPFVSVDAVQVISAPDQFECSACEWLKYRIARTPPFDNGNKFLETTERRFTDFFIEPSVEYRYQVLTVSGSRVSDPSPAFRYRFHQPFCGDGKVDSALGEDCDDGNAVDNDGCSSVCKVEDQFHCVEKLPGQKTLCYVYAGDGICESFEEADSVSDCGHYTPPGYADNWAVLAVTEEGFSKQCPTGGILGPPKVESCNSNFDYKNSWQPCSSIGLQSFWLKIFFENPVIAASVIIHLASDGMTELSTDPKFIRVELLSTDNEVHAVAGSETMILSCKTNPVEYSIVQDLTKPFFYTQAVLLHLNSFNIAISAVRLRSFQYFDPPSILQCAQSDQLYNPKSRRCSDSKCIRSACAVLAIAKSQTTCSGYEDGDSCTVRCEEGFVTLPEVKGATALKIHCFNGQWSRPNVACKPINCGMPRIAYAEFTCMNGTDFNKSCTFHCRSPAKLKGTTATVTCGARGLWSVPEAYCQLTCPALVEPNQYAKPVSSHCKLHYQPVDSNTLTYPMGTKCKFQCKVGYHVEGNHYSKRYFRKSCNGEGHWTGPACVPVKCPEIPATYSGLYNCTRGVKVGSECSFYCPGSAAVVKSICQLSGEWNTTEPCKLPKIPCQMPVPPRDLDVECPATPVAGSSCKVRCNTYGYEPVSQSIVHTESGLKLQMLQHVPKITCTAQKLWEPDLYDLACVKRCTKEFLNDGWCDFQNNRGYCMWDGGDCCASTVRGGRVQLMFPTLCTSHLCQCLDPYAIENRNDLQRAKLAKLFFTSSSNIADNGQSRPSGEALVPIADDLLESNDSTTNNTANRNDEQQCRWTETVHGTSANNQVSPSIGSQLENNTSIAPQRSPETRQRSASGDISLRNSAKVATASEFMATASRKSEVRSRFHLTQEIDRLRKMSGAENLILLLESPGLAGNTSISTAIASELLQNDLTGIFPPNASTDKNHYSNHLNARFWTEFEELTRRQKRFAEIQQMRNVYLRKIQTSVIRALAHKYNEMQSKS